MKKFARFKGKDGSCGLKKMHIYKIDIQDNRWNSHDHFNFRVFVNGLGIPYDSIEAIKKNWEAVYGDEL